MNQLAPLKKLIQIIMNCILTVNGNESDNKDGILFELIRFYFVNCHLLINSVFQSYLHHYLYEFRKNDWKRY